MEQTKKDGPLIGVTSLSLGEGMTVVGGLESSISSFENSSDRSVDEDIVGAYA
jgi:hypothetical protein